MAGDTGPMRRALAFAKDIKRSKLVEAEFARVAKEWRETLEYPRSVEVINATSHYRDIAHEIPWLVDAANEGHELALWIIQSVTAWRVTR